MGPPEQGILSSLVCLFVCFFRGDVMGNSASTEDARPLKGPEARFFGKF